VLWPAVSARQAYPLYYNLAAPFVRAAAPEQPARALNLFSALCGGLAVGVLLLWTAEITSSLAAGVIAALLLAFSYTFWSQAVIAEVYTLHLLLVGTCGLALAAYARQPGLARLAGFFAVYALAFGNHLSMILLLPPFALCLLLMTPSPSTLFRLRVVGLALVIAALGTGQYWPNLASVVTAPDAPAAWSERAAAFWFDTTKSDWRESMVLGIRGDQVGDRLGMWWFDARQQFGAFGLALAAAGAAALWRHSRAWGATVIAAWLVTSFFALTYNVGDTHVFFLPAHYLAALCAGASVLWFRSGRPRAARPVVVGALVAFALWRGWSSYPALDRHDDRRGEALVARLALGISDPDALLVSAMNWQLENVLLYTARHARPDLTWTRLGDVLPHFPFLLQDQREIGRAVVLTRDAAAEVAAAYGNAASMFVDPLTVPEPLAAQAGRVVRGAAYVLTVLTPPRDEALDTADLAAAVTALTGGRAPQRQPNHYELVAGRAGDSPAVYRSSPRPFTVTFELPAMDDALTVRMDAWLPSDTFRRAGFGHVLRGRERLQILERGVNLVWIEADGRPARPVYAASLFAPQPRFILGAITPELAGTAGPFLAIHP
jgi:hypothetical protein